MSVGPVIAAPALPPVSPALAAACRRDFGVFRDGWTPADIARVLPRWTKALGLRLVCVWAVRDRRGFGGDAELVVVRERQVAGHVQRRYAELPAGLWVFLTGEAPEAEFGLDAPDPDQAAVLAAWFDRVRRAAVGPLVPRAMDAAPPVVVGRGHNAAFTRR